MRIIVLQTIGGFNTSKIAGGGVLHLVELTREWYRSGNETDFVTNSSDCGNDVYSEIGKLHRLPSVSNSLLLGMLFNFFFQKRPLYGLLGDIVNKCQPDSILVTVSPYPSDVLAAFLVTRRMNLPAVVYFHHISPAPWKNPLKRGGVSRAILNWAMSQFALFLVKVGDILPCINNPVEIHASGWRFKSGIMKDNSFLTSHPQQGTVRWKERGNEACFVGRIAPSKGAIDLLKTWRLVSNHIPNAKLMVAGKPTSERIVHKLVSLRKRLHLEQNVSLNFRYVSDSEKREILANSRIFLFPSYEEGWSLSVMEAVLNGVLPITYDLAAYDYLGSLAVKAPIGNVEILAEKTIQMLGRRDMFDEVMRNLAANTCQFTAQKVAADQISVFRQFVSSRRIKSL